MINLYAENETDYTKNGLATLQPLSATFAPNINGAWSLTLVLPYDGTNKYSYVQKNCKIKCDVGCIREQAEAQIFRIYDIKKNLTTITVNAHPIGMEAQFDAPIEELKIPSEPGVMTASGQDIAAVLNNYIKTHDDNDKYTISSNVSAQGVVEWVDTNAIAAISGSDDGSFVNKLGGEVLYDNLNITIKNKIGNYDGHHPVVYGRNLTGMEHDLDMSSVVTRSFPKSTDGLRLHQYDDVDIDYWYGTFENGQRKNYAKSQYIYSYDYHTWFYFDADGKMSKEPIPAETLALLNSYGWHEDETGWYYGDGVPGSGNYIANAWVEHSDGKHYWMGSDGYMVDAYTDSEVWTWNQFDTSGENYGEKRLSYVDSSHIRDYPYIRSAFLSSPYQLLDTDSKSISITAKATAQWTETLYNTIYNKASEVWEGILKDLTNTYCPQYIQDIILGDNSIVEYTQARYAYSHKGWQSLIKSLIKEAVEWVEDVELDPERWIHLDGYWYGNLNADGSRHNYARSQYIYAYSESKWYWFDEDGIMSTEEIPQETIDLLNTYDWHEDEQGEYYGDGQGNYMTNAWIESSNGNHYWVNSEGYYEPEWDDTTPWDWTDIDGYQYGRSSQQFAKSEYVVINKQLEYFGSDGFWHDWERVSEEDMGWYLDATLNKWWYGSKKRYFAHNEFVYMTVDGTLEEWWYDSDGWYDADSSGETSFGWHGDESTGIWFGEEDAGTGDKNKYIHDKWAFIDGTYYWFDSDGYISGDATKAKQDWAWGDLVDEVTGKHWFGNENKDFNRMWLSNQWFKIDGTWYYFDSDGYMVDTNTMRSQMVTYFSNAITSALTPVATATLKEAYDLLYDLMTNWVNDQYNNGLDLPNITVSVDLVDLSKTTEYADYQDLEKICLGDGVDCIDYVHNMSISARVVGLTYDILRGHNTQVTLGQLAKAMVQIVKPNTSGASSNSNQTLIAGDGVKKDGNVISTTGTPGTSYGIQDVIYEETSLVSGNVAVLDDVIPEVIDVVANPEAEATDDLIKLQVDGVVYQILGGGGSGNIYYGYDAPTGGADKDAYFQLAHGYADLFEVGTQSSNIVISDFERGEDDTYSYTTSGYANSGNDDAQMIIDGLIIGNEYKISFDFQFGNQTTWIGGHVNTAQIWVHGTSSDWGDNSVVIESGYNKKHYEITFTAEIKDGTVFALCFNNCTDGTEMLGYVTNLVIDGEFDRQYDSDYDTPVKLFLNKEGNWREYLKYSAGENIHISEDGEISAIDTTYSEFVGATSIENGASGLVPQPRIADRDKFLKGDGTWAETSGGSSNLSGVDIPTSAQGHNNDIYMKYNTTGAWTTAWTGSASTSMWANPVTIQVNPDDYENLRFIGTSGGGAYNVEVEPDNIIPNDQITSDDDWVRLGSYGWMCRTNDGEAIMLYTQSGYNTSLTEIDGFTSETVDGIDKIYGKLKDAWYEFPTVTANPSGTPTNTLSTIEIDGTVYDIEGSSGEGYTEDVLWNTGGTTSSWASPLTITLSENISDYDVIRISFTDVDENNGFIEIPTSEIPSNYADKYFVGAGDFLATVKVNSNTSISCYAKNGITMTYNNVIGISYGSGGSGGGGGGETEEGIIIFDGAWKNQDIMTTTPYLATISNNELVCSGMHCGIVVSDVSGLTSEYSPYQLIVEGYSNGFSLQAGRCNPTDNLNAIIATGANRITYTNDSIATGTFKVHLTTYNNTQGVFFGGGYNVSSTQYAITKITLAKQNTEKTYS